MLGNEDGQLCPGQQDTDCGNVPSKIKFKTNLKYIKKGVKSELFVFCINLNLLLLNVA
jgi:hypothetical protein